MGTTGGCTNFSLRAVKDGLVINVVQIYTKIPWIGKVEAQSSTTLSLGPFRIETIPLPPETIYRVGRGEEGEEMGSISLISYRFESHGNPAPADDEFTKQANPLYPAIGAKISL